MIEVSGPVKTITFWMPMTPHLFEVGEFWREYAAFEREAMRVAMHLGTRRTVQVSTRKYRARKKRR